MFSVHNGNTFRIKYARTGVKQSGENYAILAFVEKENQPAGLEHPSKSNCTVKAWIDKLPEGVTDGGMVRLVSQEGFDIKHIQNERFGKPVYEDVTEIYKAVFVAVPEEK